MRFFFRASKGHPAAGGGGGGTITNIQVGGTTTANSTSGARTFDSNVTSGNLLVITVSVYKGANDPFVVGDISQTAGTATVGAFALNVNRIYEYSASNWLETAIFTTIVTGTGSCTITVGGAPVGSYWFVTGSEYNSTTGWNASRQEATNSAEGASGAPSSGDATSAGGALFIGAVSFDTDGTTITEDGAFSLIAEAGAADTHQDGAGIYRIVTTGTTDAASWTAPTTSEWVASVAAFKTA